MPNIFIALYIVMFWCNYVVFTFVVVQVGFMQSAFSVNEADGSVSVCTAVSGAVLDRNITVLLSTQDLTATCKIIFMFSLPSYQLARLYCVWAVYFFMGGLTSALILEKLMCVCIKHIHIYRQMFLLATLE